MTNVVLVNLLQGFLNTEENGVDQMAATPDRPSWSPRFEPGRYCLPIIFSFLRIEKFGYRGRIVAV